MNILHVPTWYPTEDDKLSGIFIKNHIETINSYDDNKHFLLSWHRTRYSSLKKPLSFVKGFFNSLTSPERSNQDGLQVVNFNYFNSHEQLFGSNEKRLCKKIRGIVKKISASSKIDLIHAHVTYPGGFLAMKLSRKLGIPYIISEHMGPFPFPEYREKEFLSKRIVEPVKHASRVIAVSNFQKNEIMQWTGSAAEVIPNVVDEELFNVSDKPVGSMIEFILVGILSEVKGIDILLNAVKKVADKGIHNFHISIIGSGAILDELRAQSAQLKIEQFISWKGAMDQRQIARELRESDCFISSSRHESFGVAIVEALATGLPVIATKSGGPEDIIKQNNGILVNKEDPGALAEAIIEMTGSVRKYSKTGIRSDFLDRYSTKVIAGLYNKLYREVV